MRFHNAPHTASPSTSTHSCSSSSRWHPNCDRPPSTFSRSRCRTLSISQAPARTPRSRRSLSFASRSVPPSPPSLWLPPPRASLVHYPFPETSPGSTNAARRTRVAVRPPRSVLCPTPRARALRPALSRARASSSARPTARRRSGRRLRSPFARSRAATSRGRPKRAASTHFFRDRSRR